MMDNQDHFENNELDDILNELEETPSEEERPEAEPVEEEAPEAVEIAAPRRRRRWPWVVLGVFLLLAAVITAFGIHAYGEVKELTGLAYSLMDEAKLAMDQAKDGDFAAVERTLQSVDARLDTVDSALDEPLWKLAARVPGPGGDLTKLRALFGIWDNAYADVITPALATLQTHPLPDLESLDKKALVKDTDMLEAYVQLGLAVLPACERCMDDFCAIPTLSIPQLEEKMAEVRSLIDTARPVLPLAMDLLENAAVPAVDTLKRAPLDELKGEVNEWYVLSLRADYILEYLKLVEALIPHAEGWLEQLETLADRLPDKLGTLITENTPKARELLALYGKAEKYLPLARAYLDVDGYHEYIIAIQNTAEPRGSGGYPGNMMLLYMDDGMVKLSPFRTAYGLLKRYINFKDPLVTPTPTELQMFYEFVHIPRDAVINPHFPRVAEIWCRSGSDWRVEGHHIRDGVISIQPTLVQDFLAVLDAEIELSDGTVLDGSNATRFLQHDLYMKYFNNWEQNVYANNTDCDAMFAEAGKAVMELVKTGLKLDMIDDLIDVVDKHIANRSMMFWLSDPEGQTVIEELGASGGLNSDPENPEVGVYFSGTVSSKLGWYIDLEVDVGDGRQTGDVMTYPVTITMRNNLEWMEFSTTSAWVVGTAYGSPNPFIYVFAPAGGTVSNFVCSTGIGMVMAEYQDLQVGYHSWVGLPTESELVITCDVTTAPGVTTPLGVDKTATLQEYRQAG